MGKELALALKASVDRIVREEKEILILRELFSSPIGKLLVFRGGTALRLAYGSPRFSDDLDFSYAGSLKDAAFKGAIEALVAALPDARLSDFASKRFTHLAELKFKEEWLRIGYSVKIEVSKRKTYAKGKGYELKLITSPVSNMQVLGNVVALETILQEKIAALKDRREPRDLFDIWLICERNKQRMPRLEIGIDPVVLKRTLRKYLPSDFWPVIPQLAEKTRRR